MEKQKFFYKIENNGRVNNLADEYNKVFTTIKIEPPQPRQINKTEVNFKV